MDFLKGLNGDHKKKLEWFQKHSNKEVNWSDTLPGINGLEGKVFLFNRAKGIFKPKDTKYVLSIKVMKNSRYPDEKLILRKDGSWTFRYHQEEGKNSDALYTNKGLIACIEDRVPIGVAIQKSRKPNVVKYLILGIAVVSELRDGFFQINGFSNDGLVNEDSYYGPYSKALNIIDLESFDPISQQDAREKVLRNIIQRQGQKKFREKLLGIYNSTCIISKCKTPCVLEAAHITPYLGPETNHPSNGFVLRADIHTLWDLGLIAIDPTNMTINIHQLLEGSEYDKYHLNKIELDLPKNEAPSQKSLEQQWILFKNKIAD